MKCWMCNSEALSRSVLCRKHETAWVERTAEREAYWTQKEIENAPYIERLMNSTKGTSNDDSSEHEGAGTGGVGDGQGPR